MHFWIYIFGSPLPYLMLNSIFMCVFVYNIYNLYDNIKHYFSVTRSPAIKKQNMI